jgi:glycosyltransferase involved in cell wall biosynthesis
MDADRYLHRQVTALSDAIIAHSPSAADQIGREFDVESDKLRVIPHGHFRDWYPDDVDRKPAREYLGLGSGPVFLFFGQIRPYKNVPSLVEAFHRLADESAELVVAGKPVDEQISRRLRDAAGESDRIHLRNEFIPDDEVQYYFRACDAVVLPYRDILTSGTAVLAMSFGRPVIAPGHGPLQDLIGEDAGVTYDADADDARLRSVLEWASGHLAELEASGEAAGRRADDWGWASIGQATRSLYDEIRG